jgi:hypothetical protein
MVCTGRTDRGGPCPAPRQSLRPEPPGIARRTAGTESWSMARCQAQLAPPLSFLTIDVEWFDCSFVIPFSEALPGQTRMRGIRIENRIHHELIGTRRHWIREEVACQLESFRQRTRCNKRRMRACDGVQLEVFDAINLRAEPLVVDQVQPWGRSVVDEHRACAPPEVRVEFVGQCASRARWPEPGDTDDRNAGDVYRRVGRSCRNRTGDRARSRAVALSLPV